MIFGVCLFASLLFVSYLVYRNERVYDYQRKSSERIFKSQMEWVFDRTKHPLDYTDIPDYNTMMLKFWVWPLSKFESKEFRDG